MDISYTYLELKQKFGTQRSTCQKRNNPTTQLPVKDSSISGGANISEIITTEGVTSRFQGTRDEHNVGSQV